MANEREKIAALLVSRSITSFDDDDERKIKIIGEYAFCQCKALTSVNIPVAKEINMAAFYSCSSLIELIVGTGISTICSYNNKFSYMDPSNENLKIYVPDELVDSYKAATNWSRLASKIYGISERPTT